MTHQEQILKAVAALMKQEGTKVFTRDQFREKWISGYTSIFPAMRVDQAGHAPTVGAQFKGVFRQVAHGEHTLTDYGRQVVSELQN